MDPVEEILKESNGSKRLDIFFNLLEDKINIENLERIIVKENLFTVSEMSKKLYNNVTDFNKLYNIISNCDNCKLLQWFAYFCRLIPHYEKGIYLYKKAAGLGSSIALECIIKLYNYLQKWSDHGLGEFYKESIYKPDSIKLSEELLKLHKDNKHAIICLIRNKYQCQNQFNCNNCKKDILLCDEAINLGNYSLYKNKKELYSSCECCEDIYKEIECAYEYMKKTKKTLFSDDIANEIMDRYIKLEEKYEKLKTHLDYKPGGDGYLEAFSHFNANKKKL